MPKLAHDIVIDHKKKHISIDGEEFPWHTPLEEIEATISPSGIHRITISILFDGSFRSWGEPLER
ncbi:hypothetical protein [Arthrobacter sp. ISL-95]|uniref:hypothetical protein n=1 Tax=Arthrobacter sp. ISL-95 TaxID=2819116 RepID=UPI001BE7FDB4|nr:hypothetical protein [Arthrobacter sp. ISL-95]MBT2587937.1 hypothetical protein [Arthrobacter sp. ISL-95]